MRYELYKQIKYNDKSIIFYIFENNCWQRILTYIENSVLDDTSKYLIVDNNTPYPVNYSQLGFNKFPTKEEHYKIIYECKLAREYYHQIKEDDYDDCYLNYENTALLSNSILAIAEFQTAIYFEKYNAKCKK